MASVFDDIWIRHGAADRTLVIECRAGVPCDRGPHLGARDRHAGE